MSYCWCVKGPGIPLWEPSPLCPHCHRGMCHREDIRLGGWHGQRDIWMKEAPQRARKVSPASHILHIVKKMNVSDLLSKMSWFLPFFPAVSGFMDMEPCMEGELAVHWLQGPSILKSSNCSQRQHEPPRRSMGGTEAAIPLGKIRYVLFISLLAIFQDWAYLVMPCETMERSTIPSLKSQDSRKIVNPEPPIPAPGHQVGKWLFRSTSRRTLSVYAILIST